jgi:hypothetical protein
MRDKGEGIETEREGVEPGETGIGPKDKFSWTLPQ